MKKTVIVEYEVRVWDSVICNTLEEALKEAHELSLETPNANVDVIRIEKENIITFRNGREVKE